MAKNGINLVSGLITLFLFFSLSGFASSQKRLVFQDCLNSFQNQNYEQAYKNCIGFADSGDVQAQTIIGGMFMMGDGFEEDIPKAIKYLKMAASQGHAGAAYAVGAIYTTGEMMTPNYEEGYKWIKKGASLGSIDAKDLLSTYHLMGLGGAEKDPALALHYMKAAAYADRVPSIYKLAGFYENGIGTPIDKARALLLYEQASKAGYQQATNYLASPQGRVSLGLENDDQAVPLPPRELTVQRGLGAMMPDPPGYTNEFKLLHDRPMSENDEVIEYLKQNVRGLSTPFVFELARRLGYNDMDEGILWFKVAQIRSLIDAYKCTDATARQGILAWPVIVPEIVKAISENPQREKDVFSKALEIEATFPDDISPQWICLHGMAAISASMRGEEIKDWHYPKNEWPRIRKDTLQKIIEGMEN